MLPVYFFSCFRVENSKIRIDPFFCYWQKKTSFVQEWYFIFNKICCQDVLRFGTGQEIIPYNKSLVLFIFFWRKKPVIVFSAIRSLNNPELLGRRALYSFWKLINYGIQPHNSFHGVVNNCVIHERIIIYQLEIQSLHFFTLTVNKDLMEAW